MQMYWSKLSLIETKPTECNSMPLPRVVWDDFCPLCLCRRACRVRACAVEEEEDDVDALQEHYALTRRNGLVVFALRGGGGEVCSDSRFCQLTCLACGCAVIHGEETEDFAPFRRTVLGERGGASVATLHAILERRRAVMTTFWDTPVHERCARQMPSCMHFVPREAPFCAECFGSARDSDEVRLAKQQQAVRRAMMPGRAGGGWAGNRAGGRAVPGCAWVFSELLPRLPRIPWKPGRSTSERRKEEEVSSGPVRRLADATKAGRGTGAVMSKPPFFATARKTEAEPRQQQQVFFADEEACRSLAVVASSSSCSGASQGPGGRRGGVVLRKPKPPSRPKPPRAANQHSVSEMLGAGGARAGMAKAAGVARAGAGKGNRWCFWQHCRSFDESVHGFRMIKGQLVYRFPDGRTVRAGEVSSITEDGELVPEEAGAGEGCIESGREASSI